MKKLLLALCFSFCLLMSSVAIANAPDTTLNMSVTESAQFIESNANSIKSVQETVDVIIIVFDDGTVIIIILC